jgi:hypothetical protein
VTTLTRRGATRCSQRSELPFAEKDERVQMDKRQPTCGAQGTQLAPPRAMTTATTLDSKKKASNDATHSAATPGELSRTDAKSEKQDPPDAAGDTYDLACTD